MVGTSSHELISVSAARAKCAVRTEPLTCLMVASGSTMANRLATAANTTRTRMKGAVESSSMYLVQICAAVRRVIQMEINVRNKIMPPFQHTSTRLKIDQSCGRKKNSSIPAMNEIHS